MKQLVLKLLFYLGKNCDVVTSSNSFAFAFNLKGLIEREVLSLLQIKTEETNDS